MNKLKLLIAGLIGLCSILAMANGKIINCNFNFHKINETNISTGLCTHLTYLIEIRFMASGIFEYRVAAHNIYKLTKDWRRANTQFKFILGLCIRGTFHKKSLDDQKRANFIKYILIYIEDLGFDGLDLKWDFVDQYEVETQTNSSFVKFIEELSTKFKPRNYELSISVDGAADADRIRFDVPSIVNHVNFINIQAYGFAKPDTKKLIYNAPNRGQGKNNIRSVIKNWIRKGVPPQKLVLGIPFYGLSYSLPNFKPFDVGGSANLKSPHVSYNKICPLENKWNNTWDIRYDTSLVLTEDELINYDNTECIKQKVQFGNCLGLAGFMVSNLEDDDFRGDCGEKFPLLKAIHN